jgi:hypothetical protein
VHYFFRILGTARSASVMLLNSSSGKLYPELIASAALGFVPRRRRPIIAMMGSMWDVEPGLKYQMERIFVRLANRAIDRFIVQSSEELTVFPKTWGIEPPKMRLCLYFYTFTEEDLAAPAPEPGDYIFAGGNSHRDYEPLVEAARQMPDLKFLIATSRLRSGPGLPSNVTVRDVPHAEFVQLMRAARAVVVPMRPMRTRAAGQQTYLNAMLLRKPTVIKDSFAVHDHVRDKENALIVDGSPQSYVDAIRWVLDPANADRVARLCEEAHRSAKNDFSFEKHVSCLLSTMDEAASDPQLARGRAKLQMPS